jgi:hypothetical protein
LVTKVPPSPMGRLEPPRSTITLNVSARIQEPSIRAIQKTNPAAFHR